MMINILSFTIMIKKRKYSIEEAIHQEIVKKLYEENEVQRFSKYHM
ncbi:YrzI family small protein [Neobacillus vireti]